MTTQQAMRTLKEFKEKIRTADGTVDFSLLSGEIALMPRELIEALEYAESGIKILEDYQRG